MKEITIGLVGCGGMAQSHIREIGKHKNVRISAICDIKPETLSRVGGQLGIPGDKRYEYYTDLINDPEVQVILSVTPNDVHAGVIRASLSAKKPIMAEKPFTRTYEEALELVELYKQNPVPCMVGFSYRYQPAFRYAKHLIESGKLGPIRHVSFRYLQGWGASKYNQPKVWRFDKARTGTGTLGDLGAHMIDMARYLIGEFEEVSGQLQTFIHERPDEATGQMVAVDVDDFASFQARLEGGVMAVFQTTRNAFGSGNQHEVSIYGDVGTVHASTLNNTQVVLVQEREENGETVKARELLDVPAGFITTQWDEFIKLLQGNDAEGISTFMDGYFNQEILEAIVRSDETKRTVPIRSIRPEGLF